MENGFKTFVGSLLIYVHTKNIQEKPQTLIDIKELFEEPIKNLPIQASSGAGGHGGPPPVVDSSSWTHVFVRSLSDRKRL